MLKVIVTV